MAVFILVLFNLSSFSQERYRFSVNGGFHSMMFWGRSFENIAVPNDNDVHHIYEHEVYNVVYKKFRSSGSYTFGFSVNWFNKPNWSITQDFGLFKGTLNDGMQQTLTETGTDTVYHQNPTYNSTNVKTGNQTNLAYRTEVMGCKTSIIFLHRLQNKKNITLGGGVYWMTYSAKDYWRSPFENYTDQGYRPTHGFRASGVYLTRQLGISVNARWSWKFLAVYLNLGNNVITTKKSENKGYAEWIWSNPPFHFFPTSHNFDYRFPLTFETGISISFDRIKKR